MCAQNLSLGTLINVDNKPFVLCVDLDGVVADYEKAFQLIVSREVGLTPEVMGPQLSWDFATGNWGIKNRDHYLELHTKAVVEERMFANMPAIEGASDALWRLSDAGVWVRIVTHRLVVKNTHHVAVEDTVTWLDQPRPDGRPLVPYRDLCFIGAKAQVGGDCYLDDAPHNIESLRKAGWDCIVMDANYNRDVPGPRARNWDEVEELVMAKMEWIASNPMK